MVLEPIFKVHLPKNLFNTLIGNRADLLLFILQGYRKWNMLINIGPITTNAPNFFFFFLMRTLSVLYKYIYIYIYIEMGSNYTFCEPLITVKSMVKKHS